MGMRPYTITSTDSTATLTFTWGTEPTPTIIRAAVAVVPGFRSLDLDTSTQPFTGTITVDLASLDSVISAVQLAEPNYCDFIYE